MTDQPPTVGKSVDRDDPRHPLKAVWMVADGVFHGFTKSEAMQLALDLYATASGHEPTDPYDTARLEPAEEAAEVENVSPSPWEPTAAERARAIELFAARADINGTPQTWEQALLNYCRDVNRDQITPASTNALVSYGLTAFVGLEPHGDVIRAKIATDLGVAEEIAFEDWKAEQDD